jgi:hypothetical protein
VDRSNMIKDVHWHHGVFVPLSINHVHPCCVVVQIVSSLTFTSLRSFLIWNTDPNIKDSLCRSWWDRL